MRGLLKDRMVNEETDGDFLLRLIPTNPKERLFFTGLAVANEGQDILLRARIINVEKTHKWLKTRYVMDISIDEET